VLDLVYPIVGTADIFRRDLPNSRHGGVLIVSRKHFQLGNIITNQYPSRVNQSFLDMVSDNSFEHIVNFPTRKQNTLDIILTTHSSFTQRCKSKPSIGNSDHDIVLFDTTITATRPKPPRRKILLWKKADIQCIRDDLSDLSSITNLNDPSIEDS